LPSKEVKMTDVSHLIVCILILLIVLWKTPEVISFDRKYFTGWVNIFIIALPIKIGVNYLLFENMVVNNPLIHVHWVTFLLVFLEDIIFGMGIYVAKDVLKLNKLVWIPIAICLSIYFALGHTYQGLLIGLITGFIPFFVMYRYGKKYGFLTIMALHVSFDVYQYLTMLLSIKLFK
jgi:hypothetical protein